MKMGDEIYVQFSTSDSQLVFTKETTSSTVEIPSAFLGTWTNDTLEFTIESTTLEFTIGKQTFTIASCTETMLICYVNGDVSNRVSFMIMGNQFTDGNSIVFSKK